jgi:hypothetical protein
VVQNPELIQEVHDAAAQVIVAEDENRSKVFSNLHPPGEKSPGGSDSITAGFCQSFFSSFVDSVRLI